MGKRETLKINSCKKCFCLSLFSSRSHFRADRCRKLLPLREPRNRVRAVTKIRKKTVSHLGHTLEKRHRRVPHNERACTSCANLALCVSKRSMHFSAFFVQHLHWHILCVSFSRTSPSSRHVPGSVQVLLQYLARITFALSAQTFSTSMKETFLKSPFSSRTKVVTIAKFLQRIAVISELFCPWCGISCRSPFVGHARFLSRRFWSKIAASTCW